MKILILISFIFISGCAYNSVSITAESGSTVNCTSTVDKPVDVKTLTEPFKGSTNTVPLSALGI